MPMGSTFEALLAKPEYFPNLAGLAARYQANGEYAILERADGEPLLGRDKLPRRWVFESDAVDFCSANRETTDGYIVVTVKEQVSASAPIKPKPKKK